MTTDNSKALRIDSGKGISLLGGIAEGKTALTLEAWLRPAPLDRKARLYPAAGYGGDPVALKPGKFRDLKQLVGGIVGSVCLPDAIEIVLFEKTDFSGRAVAVRQDAHNLADGPMPVGSAVVIDRSHRRQTFVVLFDEKDFEGRAEVLNLRETWRAGAVSKTFRGKTTSQTAADDMSTGMIGRIGSALIPPGAVLRAAGHSELQNSQDHSISVSSLSDVTRGQFSYLGVEGRDKGVIGLVEGKMLLVFEKKDFGGEVAFLDSTNQENHGRAWTPESAVLVDLADGSKGVSDCDCIVILQPPSEDELMFVGVFRPGELFQEYSSGRTICVPQGMCLFHAAYETSQFLPDVSYTVEESVNYNPSRDRDEKMHAFAHQCAEQNGPIPQGKPDLEQGDAMLMRDGAGWTKLKSAKGWTKEDTRFGFVEVAEGWSLLMFIFTNEKTISTPEIFGPGIYDLSRIQNIDGWFLVSDYEPGTSVVVLEDTAEVYKVGDRIDDFYGRKVYLPYWLTMIGDGPVIGEGAHRLDSTQGLYIGATLNQVLTCDTPSIGAGVSEISSRLGSLEETKDNPTTNRKRTEDVEVLTTGKVHLAIQRVHSTLENGHDELRFSGSILRPERWSHISITRDDTQAIFYLNGQTLGSTSTSAIEDPSFGHWALGNGFRGAIANPRVWGAVRTAQEIASFRFPDHEPAPAKEKIDDPIAPFSIDFERYIALENVVEVKADLPLAPADTPFAKAMMRRTETANQKSVQKAHDAVQAHAALVRKHGQKQLELARESARRNIHIAGMDKVMFLRGDQIVRNNDDDNDWTLSLISSRTPYSTAAILPDGKGNHFASRASYAAKFESGGMADEKSPFVCLDFLGERPEIVGNDSLGTPFLAQAFALDPACRGQEIDSGETVFQMLYWICEDGTIWQAPVTNTQKRFQLHMQVATNDSVTPANGGGPWDIAIDRRNQLLYWTNGLEILRRPLTGENHKESGTVVVSAAKAERPIALAVSEDGVLCWLSRGADAVLFLDETATQGRELELIDSLHARSCVIDRIQATGEQGACIQYQIGSYTQMPLEPYVTHAEWFYECPDGNFLSAFEIERGILKATPPEDFEQHLQADIPAAKWFGPGDDNFRQDWCFSGNSATVSSGYLHQGVPFLSAKMTLVFADDPWREARSAVADFWASGDKDHVKDYLGEPFYRLNLKTDKAYLPVDDELEYEFYLLTVDSQSDVWSFNLRVAVRQDGQDRKVIDLLTFSVHRGETVQFDIVLDPLWEIVIRKSGEELSRIATHCRSSAFYGGKLGVAIQTHARALNTHLSPVDITFFEAGISPRDVQCVVKKLADAPDPARGLAIATQSSKSDGNGESAFIYWVSREESEVEATVLDTPGRYLDLTPDMADPLDVTIVKLAGVDGVLITGDPEDSSASPNTAAKTRKLLFGSLPKTAYSEGLSDTALVFEPIRLDVGQGFTLTAELDLVGFNSSNDPLAVYELTTFEDESRLVCAIDQARRQPFVYIWHKGMSSTEFELHYGGASLSEGGRHTVMWQIDPAEKKIKTYVDGRQACSQSFPWSPGMSLFDSHRIGSANPYQTHIGIEGALESESPYRKQFCGIKGNIHRLAAWNTYLPQQYENPFGGLGADENWSKSIVTIKSLHRYLHAGRLDGSEPPVALFPLDLDSDLHIESALDEAHAKITLAHAQKAAADAHGARLKRQTIGSAKSTLSTATKGLDAACKKADADTQAANAQLDKAKARAKQDIDVAHAGADKRRAVGKPHVQTIRDKGKNEAQSKIDQAASEKREKIATANRKLTTKRDELARPK